MIDSNLTMSADDTIHGLDMAETLTPPSPEQLERLTPFERRAFELVDFVNTNPFTKAAAEHFLKNVGAKWVYYCTRRLTHLVGFDTLRHFQPRGGVVLACNHRSFFDLYVVSCWLHRTTNLLQRTYFPVRSSFFYEKTSGVIVNLMMSALAMYPPIFRQPEKAGFNRWGIKRLVQLLEQQGTVVGVHPEGRRNLSDNPYELQRAQPGVGKLIMEAKPEVLPVFINGLVNDLPRQIRSNFDGTGEPIIVVIGAPLDLSGLLDQQNTLRAQMEISEFVVSEIQRLGEREREVRAALGRSNGVGPVHHS